jgi:aspartate/methionine/tyrosine aminotransferase
MFSSRVPGQLEPNQLTRAVARARAAGRELLDLTSSNPTRAGFRYPSDMLEPLSGAAAHAYEPESRGLASARAAVVRDYAGRGIRVASDAVVLTASTSEAYSVLFKLLCAPAGDAVLVPAPSYPLFDHLTRLDGVDPVGYALEYHGRWAVDESSVDAAWSDRVRAVLAVSPNNPTGSVLSDAEVSSLSGRCGERGAALIIDEVFAEYPLAEPYRPHHGHGESGCLTFRLGGLSKSAGLPHVKLGWIAVDGPPRLVESALERLDLICDTYLSVSTPVQVAAPELIASGAAVRTQILERVRGNYQALRTIAAADPSVEVLNAEAGWSAVVRIPSTQPEEEFTLQLLERSGVIVHPGFFFDFPHEAFVVVSLLPPPDVFAEGVRRILERVHV